MEDNEVVVESSGSVESSPSVSDELSPDIGLEGKAQLEAEGASGEVQKPAPSPAYAPNYKVKVYDSEYEIPEKFRQWMNPETEKDIRDVWERAYALDQMKAKNQKIRTDMEALNTKYSEISPKYSTIQKNLDHLGKLVELGDFDTFFNQIQIPESALQKWMYNKLQANQLPQDQRELYNQQKELRTRAFHAEVERANLQEAYSQDQATLNQYQVEKRQQDLSMVMSRPDVSSTAQAFNSRNGEYAFEKEVIQRAKWIAQTEGKDLSAEEAVNEVLKLVGGQTGQSAQSTQSRSGQNSPPPVIPHVEGRSTSPAKQLPNSVEDLKRIRQERFADHINN